MSGAWLAPAIERVLAQAPSPHHGSSEASAPGAGAAYCLSDTKPFASVPARTTTTKTRFSKRPFRTDSSSIVGAPRGAAFGCSVSVTVASSIGPRRYFYRTTRTTVGVRVPRSMSLGPPAAVATSRREHRSSRVAATCACSEGRPAPTEQRDTATSTSANSGPSIRRTSIRAAGGPPTNCEVWRLPGAPFSAFLEGRRLTITP